MGGLGCHLTLASSAAPSLRCVHVHVKASGQPLLHRSCGYFSGHSRSVVAAASLGTDPELLQNLLVGSAATGVAGWALFLGLRKEPVTCDLCRGTGGSTCFGCSGSGKMEQAPRRGGLSAATKSAMKVVDTGKEEKRADPFGRSSNPNECRVCKGTGMCMCSKCKGGGFVQTN